MLCCCAVCKVKAKQLRWQTISQHELQDTIWAQQGPTVESAQALSLDIVDLAQLKELFTETEQFKKKKADKQRLARATARTASVLDNDRERNIEIMLKTVRTSFVSFFHMFLSSLIAGHDCRLATLVVV